MGKRTICIAALLAVVTGFGVPAVSGDPAAGAASTPAIGVRVMRPVSAVATGTTPRRTAAALASDNLLYFGGPVMQASNDSVPIFWLPSVLQDGTAAPAASNYTDLIKRYFQDIGGSPLYEVNTQYYETYNTPLRYIVNKSGLLKAVIDTTPYPAAGAECAGSGPDCLTDGQIQAEVAKVIAANNLPLGLTTGYYVFTAPHESSCVYPTFCFKSDRSPTSDDNFVYCAYHSAMIINGELAVYANMPYGATAYSATGGSGCATTTSFPNGADADITINVLSHEQMEMTTDPFASSGWRDAAGQENGDRCAWDFGAVALKGGTANELWNGHYYLLQQEWDNATASCVQGTTVGGVPAAPTVQAATSGNGWVDVEFQPPAMQGSITNYTVTASPGGASATVTNTARRVLLTGLANGQNYTLTVASKTAKATSVSSNAVNATTSSATRSVTTNWSAAEYPRVAQTAAYFGTTPAQAQVTSVYAVAYVLGIANLPASTPTAPPAVTGPNSVTSSYTAADQLALTRVMRQYALNPSEAQYFSTQLIGFLLALGGH